MTSAPPVHEAWESPAHVRTLVLAAAILTGLALCFQLLLPFLSAVTWAVALAVLFAPLQRRLEKRLRRPGLAAFLSVVLVALLVLVPVSLVTQRLVSEAAHGAQLLRDKVDTGEWRAAIEARPTLAPVLHRVEQELDLPGTMRSVATWVGNLGGVIFTRSLLQMISVCLTFYLLFFFLRDRADMLRVARTLSPLSAAEMDRLFSRIGETIHATVYGSLLVAAAQGLLGGLMFWWLGLPVPLLWGVVMALLALVPMMGAFLVWVPAAAWLALDGQVEKAVILTLWGTFVVSLVDNLLRPILVGNRLKLHTVLVFISVVGGLMLFGPPGLILGPLTLTVTMALLEIWSPHTADATPMRVKAEELSRLENEGGPIPAEPAGQGSSESTP